MNSEETTIEAEVVEIDDVSMDSSIPRRQGSQESSRTQKAWGSWQGKVKNLDAHWWPLWLVLGFLLLVIVVAVGMCAAVLGVIYWVIKSVVRGVASLFVPPSQLPR